MLRLVKLFIAALLLSCYASNAIAVEVAPRITDREIIEALAELKQGQKGAEQRFNAIDKRFEAIDKRFEAIDRRFDVIDRRFEAIDKRFDVMEQRFERRFAEFNRTMLALFGSLVTLIIALFGYIAWDRRTMVRPLQEQLQTLEIEKTEKYKIVAENTARLDGLLEALRKLAQEDKKLAAVLRSFSLL